MIHVLASLPFWLIGIGSGIMGATGMVAAATKILFTDPPVSPARARRQALSGPFLLMVVSGASFTFAAWLCS